MKEIVLRTVQKAWLNLRSARVGKYYTTYPKLFSSAVAAGVLGHALLGPAIKSKGMRVNANKHTQGGLLPGATSALYLCFTNKLLRPDTSGGTRDR